MSDVQTAIVRPRIHSADKTRLEDAVPLAVPFSAHIDVCSLCNFKCSFCFQADTKGMKAAGLKRDFMPPELFRKIVDDLRAFGAPVKKIKIGNHGEPTLHKDLPDLIRYARDSGAAEIVELFTNGSKLEPELNEKLVRSGLQRINISLEGLSDLRYRQVAGVKLDFQSLVAGVADLYRRKTDLKIYVKIADRTHALGDDSNEVFVLSEEERAFFFDTFSGICDEIYVEKVVPQWAETQYEKQNTVDERGMYDQPIKQYKEICPFIFMYLHFNCDGTVSPCTLDWPRKVVIGNANDEHVREIWLGRRLRQLQVAQIRGRRKEIPFCQSCSAPMVCVEEDLDPHIAHLRSVMSITDEEMEAPNPWLTTTGEPVRFHTKADAQ